jgi:hypothetical protein
MSTIESRYADINLPCEPAAKRVVERLDEPILETADCCIYQGDPCILFGDWDYAEDWSGEFVRVIPPEPLADAPRLSAPEFWALVRKVHAVAG